MICITLELLVTAGFLRVSGAWPELSGGAVGDGLATLVSRVGGSLPSGLWIATLTSAVRDLVSLLRTWDTSAGTLDRRRARAYTKRRHA